MISARYSGAGNTFLLVDNRDGLAEVEALLLALDGADGLILAQKSQTADAFMQIYNCDGSVAEMCGNGLRCFIHFLKSLHIERPLYRIETLAGEHQGWLDGDEATVIFSPPKELRLCVAADLHAINTGVPHAVCFVDDLESVNVEERGRHWRHSPLFAPAGTNVNFVRCCDEGISVRTYERGVEKETLACGTGVVASALVASRLYGLSSPISAQVRSGDTLKISFDPAWRQVSLQGPVKREMKEKSESLIISHI